MAFTNAYDVSDTVHVGTQYASDSSKAYSFAREFSETFAAGLGYVNNSTIAFAIGREYNESALSFGQIFVITNPAIVYSTAKGITYGVSAILPGDTAAQIIEQDFLPPIASFSADIVAGYPPLTVNFTDFSTDNPSYWEWDFGDGSSHSLLQNPQHIYNDIGPKQVILMVSNGFGYDIESKPAFIMVNPLDSVTDLSVPQFLTLSANIPEAKLVLNVCAEYMFRLIRTSADIFDVTGNINTLKSKVVYNPTICEKSKNSNQGFY